VKRKWQLVPIGIVTAVRLVYQVLAAVKIEGWKGQLQYWPGVLLADGLLVLGWIIGWMIADLDKYVAKYGGKNLKEAGKSLEQWSAGVRNVLTIGVLMVAGFWVVSSTGNLLAIGLVLGLQVRLFSEMTGTKEYNKWYWVFARSFSEGENKVFLIVWAIMMIIQALFVVRG